MWVSVVIILSIFANSVQNAKILGVFPMSARSHYILGSSLMRALAERGHDVTVISPFSETDPPKNGSYRDIVLTGFAEDHDKKIKELNFFKKRSSKLFVLMAPIMSKMMIEMTEKTLNHSNVQKLIHSDETFDVVILEEFMNQALKAFAAHFKGHLVLLSTMGANSWVNGVVGNPNPLSYVSDTMLGYSSEMTFSERMINTACYVMWQTVNHLYVFPQQNQLIKKYFPNGPDLDDVLYNTSLVLLNSHPSTNQPVPYVPQMVDIGGFHVQPPKKLPNDLQKYLDNAKNGVIYFSLGSNTKSALMPIEKRQAFLHTFSQLKEDILWKWEEEEMEGKSDNIRLAKWLPQQDILAHPNVKLFITHAGLLSTIETIYHGMPVLALPIGGDQNLNAKQIVNQGVGLALSFHDVTHETLTESIHKVLNDPTYRKNAKARSEFFHNRLVQPMDTAIYWVEYVIRHGGTPHLRVAGLDLPWYQYLLLDVIAVIVVVGVVSIYALCTVVSFLFSFRSKQKKIKVKKQ